MAKLYLDLLLLLIYRRLDWLAVPLAPGSTSLDIGIRTSFSARPWMFRRLLIGCTVIGAAWLPLERHRVLSSLVFQIVRFFLIAQENPSFTSILLITLFFGCFGFQHLPF